HISVRDTVYVGLYPASGGDVSISGGVTFDTSQLTLTCISTGGPATTVTWTRDSTTVTQGTQTVLNDPVTAQYTHTLTVTTGGVYTCTVANNKPSSGSASTIIAVGLTVSATPSSSTSLTISWTLEDSLTATSYTISYSNTNTDCFTDSRSGISASGTSYTLTGLEEGTEYSITVTATLTGNGGTQEGSTTATTLTAAPSAPPTDVVVRVESSTSITVQWGPVECRHQNGEITGYWVRYGEEGSSEEGRSVQMVSGDSSGGMTTVSGLTKETVYTVQVAAVTSGGTGVYSDPLTIQTPDDVFLSLNGAVIPNNGLLNISDIGSTDNTALLCITNR
ncbi:Neogenin, partial [Geodia barretti]